jgi:type IV pilus assembly protein PilE
MNWYHSDVLTAQSTRGLTLIELLIVVAVLAILATIAVPTYDRYQRGARRADAKVALTTIAHAQERAFSVYQRYVSLASIQTLAGLDAEIAGGKSPKLKYDVSLASLTATRFVAQAVPVAEDAECGTLQLSSTGEKTVKTGTASKTADYCW